MRILTISGLDLQKLNYLVDIIKEYILIFIFTIERKSFDRSWKLNYFTRCGYYDTFILYG